MRKGTVGIDLPRFMARNTPWWLTRANLIVWVVTLVPALLGRAWGLIPWMVWVLFNFVWGYRSWRAAGRPAIDEQPSLEFRLSALKSLWPKRDQK